MGRGLFFYGELILVEDSADLEPSPCLNNLDAGDKALPVFLQYSRYLMWAVGFRSLGFKDSGLEGSRATEFEALSR